MNIIMGVLNFSVMRSGKEEDGGMKIIGGCPPLLNRELCISNKYVIPVKTGIQEVIENTGFRLQPE